jgi:hypothetical protein
MLGWRNRTKGATRAASAPLETASRNVWNKEIATMAVSPLIVNNFIDSCAFDPKYEPETSSSLEILKLSGETHFLLQIAHSTQDEIDHPNTPDWVKHQAQWLIYTIKGPLSPSEKTLLSDIETILAGKGKAESIRHDACHVFEPQKYGRYFITTDERILSRAQSLEGRCSITVLKPSEFLALVRNDIAKK